MKINKTILAAVLGLSVVGAAEAGTVTLTGSTAARSSVQLALNTVGIVFNAAPQFTAYENDNYMAFIGNDLSGNPLTVLCHWSGSEAGIKDVALAQSQQFIASGFNGIDNGATEPPTTTSLPVDLGMADNAQGFSRTKTPVVNTNTQVGVITFAWVRNPGLWNTSSNVSSSAIKQALGGFAPRSVFDGNPADINDYVYVSGRDFSSGTRVNTYGDSGFGILTPPQQIEVNKTTGDLQSDTDINGTTGVFFGDIGFSSGGTLAGTLGVSTVGKSDAQALGGTGGYSVIGYLSRNDANTAITAGAIECTYNGVSFSRNGILEGAYSFWGYEFIFQRNGVGSQAQAAYNELKTGIATAAGHSSANFIPTSDMDCQRSGPNGGIQHL